jgi:DNA mismatch repair protein MutS2
MDEHTLQLLEFDKVREIVAGYAPSPLGRERVRQLAPKTDRAAILNDLRLVSEMVNAIALGRAPGFGDLVEVRPHVRRARAEAMLSGEDLRGHIARTQTAARDAFRARR